MVAEGVEGWEEGGYSAVISSSSLFRWVAGRDGAEAVGSGLHEDGADDEGENGVLPPGVCLDMRKDVEDQRTERDAQCDELGRHNSPWRQRLLKEPEHLVRNQHRRHDPERQVHRLPSTRR